MSSNISTADYRKGRIFRILLSLLPAAAVLFLLKDIFLYDAGLRADFNVSSGKPLKIGLFYTTTSVPEFSMKNSVVVSTSPRVAENSISIPCGKPEKLRLSIYSSPEDFTISDLKINGKKIDWRKTSMGRIGRASVITADKAEFHGIKGRLHIVFDRADIHAEEKVDGVLLFSVAAILLFVFYSLLSMMSGISVSDKKTFVPDMVFAVIIIVSLFVPAMKIDRREISKNENRTLEKFHPLFSGDGRINVSFGKQFDAFFSDRFLGREKLMRLNSLVTGINENRGNDRVIIGTDGWMFYRKTLNTYRNVNPFSEKALSGIERNLSWFENLCKKHNMKFYFMIAPDKCSVYGEHIRFIRKLNPDSGSRSAKLLEYLNANTQIKIISPLKAILDAKNENRYDSHLYYKNDTHWNHMGAYVGYLEFMKKIKNDFPDIETFRNLECMKRKYPENDLSAMFSEIPEDNTTEYAVPKAVLTEKYRRMSAEAPVQRRYSGGRSPLRIAVIHDSFIDFMVPYLDRTFSKCIFMHKNVPLTGADIREIVENYDILLFEVVERNLSDIGRMKIPEGVE